MIKIVALDGYTLNPGDLSWDDIAVHGTLEVFNRSTIIQGQERAKDAQVLIVNKFIIDEAFLSYCNAVKLICISATGTNNVDLAACRERDITVCNVANYSTSGVAQHVFAMLLHWLNQITQHNNLVKKGYWSICPDFSFTASPIHELASKKFGILGYGDIGVESDVLSLHASLNEDTKEIINKQSLSKMKPTAILINTSRGGLIHEYDLAEFLEEEKIQAALLDVMCDEPALLQHPFYRLTNCKITPHIAWSSVQSRTRLMQSISQNIAAFFEGTPKNLVN